MLALLFPESPAENTARLRLPTKCRLAHQEMRGRRTGTRHDRGVSGVPQLSLPRSEPLGSLEPE